MQELDNIGDSNRWEDPRDTVNGQTEAELVAEAEAGYDVEKLINAPNRREVDWHRCHFCGDYVANGRDYVANGIGIDGKRHWLSDCRPDLVEHEIGPLCTWHGQRGHPEAKDCYAYRNDSTNQWTDDHIHFMNDGPM